MRDKEPKNRERQVEQLTLENRRLRSELRKVLGREKLLRKRLDELEKNVDIQQHITLEGEAAWTTGGWNPATKYDLTSVSGVEDEEEQITEPKSEEESKPSSEPEESSLLRYLKQRFATEALPKNLPRKTPDVSAEIKTPPHPSDTKAFFKYLDEFSARTTELLHE